MKTNRLHLIKQELISNNFNKHTATINYLSMLYVNTDLILFICRMLNNCKPNEDRELVLIKLKKLLMQTPRRPDPEQYRVDREFFDSIRKEQKLNDPIRFIEAELDFIKATKAYSPEDKDMLSEDEVLKMFDISRTTLNRRIAEGMPCTKVGGKKAFSRNLISAWLFDEEGKEQHVKKQVFDSVNKRKRGK
ncbi:helix-turn-helix domain-containing protein [Mucilaginibacter sp. HC2]|uniref:helix-turn-helix transcriptional regulator n=1 Tax=Mucilaginibacter inviolabilis TaxID=2714892 RepID=UPI0014085B7A|nr:helix-turn-helix domain-containing protein [Mucilaginibacter inviolabilis]NHA07711.1 helix-turn-helix domain-containing protein [Mucilaginibacter inviolabilis]